MILITARGEMIKDPCHIGYYADSEPLVINSVIIADKAAVDAIHRYAIAVKRDSKEIVSWNELI